MVHDLIDILVQQQTQTEIGLAGGWAWATPNDTGVGGGRLMGGSVREFRC